MVTTAKGVPYPAETDANDVPADMGALAAWVDAHPGVAPLTTAQRDGLSAMELWDGRVVLNLTTGLLEKYNAAGAAWAAASVSDHGALTGLGDDDHPQYLTTGRHDTPARHGSTVVDHGSIGGLADDDHPQYHNDVRGDLRYVRPTLIDAKGDLIVGSAADVLARLGVGANGQVLTADSAQAAGLKWAGLPSYAQIAVGSYTGNSASNRTIALPFKPSFVVLSLAGSGYYWYTGAAIGDGGIGISINTYPQTGTSPNVAPQLAASGFVVGGTNYTQTNGSGSGYNYVAIG